MFPLNLTDFNLCTEAAGYMTCCLELSDLTQYDLLNSADNQRANMTTA